jgi:hypothetical protein
MEILVEEYCKIYKDLYLNNKTPLEKLKSLDDIFKWFNCTLKHVLENWSDVFDIIQLELNFRTSFINSLKSILPEILTKINFDLDKFDFSKIIYCVVKFENKPSEDFSPTVSPRNVVAKSDDFIILKKICKRYNLNIESSGDGGSKQSLYDSTSLMICFKPYIHHFYNYEKSILNTYIDELVIDKSIIPPTGYPMECTIPFLIKVKKSYISSGMETSYLIPVMENFINKIKNNCDSFPVFMNTLEYIIDACKKMKFGQIYAKEIYDKQIRLFVNKFVNQCNLVLRKKKWILTEVPGDNSDYIEDLINNYSNLCNTYSGVFTTSIFEEIVYLYHNAICDKLYGNILNIYSINNLGCQQLLVDVVSLKKEFDSIYLDVWIDITKIENLIKVIQSSESEILNVYLALVENRSVENLSRILTMKNIINKQKILDDYQEMFKTDHRFEQNLKTTLFGNIKNKVFSLI